MSPHAANEPPTSVKMTLTGWIGAGVSSSTGRSASASAITVATQSTVLTTGLWIDAASRARNGARGASARSLTGRSNGAKLVIRVSSRWSGTDPTGLAPT
jgi:hypothetical protein